jgi:hypothetical protein
VLVGEAGVGKTAIVEGLARKAAGLEGDVPDEVRNKRVLELDLTDDGRRIHIARLDHSKSTWVTVKDGGPWNLRDNYWRGGLARDRFSDLPRCVPEAQAAYQDGYNGGKDQFGRLVTNPAGVDVTPAVARELGLSTNRSAWVYVRFPWVAK